MALLRWSLRLAPFLLALLLVPAAPADEPKGAADEKAKAEAQAEAQARTFARQRLLEQARRAVRSDTRGQDPFQAMQESLAEDHAYMMAFQPRTPEEQALLAEFEKTVQERILLVGWKGDDKGTPSTDGALQEARRLDAWLAGLASCDVVIYDEGKDPADGRPYAYEWPPSPAEPAVTPPPAEGTPVEAAPPGPPPPADGGTEAPGGAGPGAPNGSKDAAGRAEPAEPGKPAEPAKPVTSEKPAKPAGPPTEPDLDRWAHRIVKEDENGTLARKVIATQVCTVVDRLLEAAHREPLYVHPDLVGLRRHAVVSEDVFAYNAPYVALRALQADERERLMQGDQPPPSLVDESMVRSRATQVAAYKKDLATREKQREAVVRALDRMVDDLEEWKTQAALLAQEIEERQRALAPPPKEGGTEGGDEGEASAEAEPAPTPIALRLAEARESLVSLDITLLYMTAARAGERLGLLDRLVMDVTAEAQSAEQVHARYADALLKLRGARRLDRLYGDQHRLRRYTSRLEERKPAADSVYAKRLEAYRTVLGVLGVVERAVIRQRELTPGGAEESKAPAKSEPPPAAAPATPAEGAGAEGPKAPANPVPSILRRPEQATWDVKYVELATRALEDPALREAFDAGLVARHYQAVDDRIRALVRAQQRSKEEAALRRDYDAARAAAESALAALPENDFAVRTRRLPNVLGAAGEDFEAAMTGIEEQGQRNRQRLDALLDYRALLTEQGTRSLLIRMDRDLATDDIRAAIGDTSEAVDRATRWLSFKGDSHAGGFLMAAWWRVLVVLALVVAAVLGVRAARRRIDAWIAEQARANPLLRQAGASLREEQEEAKRRRQEEKAATGVSVEEILQAEAPAEPDAHEETEAEREVREAHDPEAAEKRAAEAAPAAPTAPSPPKEADGKGGAR